MKTIQNAAFQGDIGFLRVDQHIKRALLDKFNIDVDAILADKTKRIKSALTSNDTRGTGIHPEKGLVLAQGESRNHFHAFRETEEVELYHANDNIRLLLVRSPQALLHEEHDKIGFGADLFVQGFQYEYDYTEEYRRVAD